MAHKSLFFSRITIITFSYYFLALSAHSTHAGKWFQHMENEQYDKAQTIAQQKQNAHYKKYIDHCTDDHFKKISSYIDIFLPHLNADLIESGATQFFAWKIAKWEERNTQDNTNAWQYKKSFDLILSNNPNIHETTWNTVLAKACQESASFSFNYMAIAALQEIVAHGKQHNSQNSAMSEAVTASDALLTLMNLDKQAEKFKNLHTILTQKLHTLLGIKPEHLSDPYQIPSMVVVIDAEFKQNIHGPTKPQNIDAQSAFPKWKKGDDLLSAWGHGDRMVDTIQIFAPQSTIDRVYSATVVAMTRNDIFSEHSADYYNSLYNKLNCPVVFNCSFAPLGIYFNLDKTGDSIWWKNEPYYPSEYIQGWKDRLKKEGYKDRKEGELTTQQIAFLQKLEDEIFPDRKHIPHLVQQLVEGPKKDQTHLLMAAPSNSSGSLVKHEFHDGWMKLLDEDATKEHALIALNYDFTTDCLVADSRSAGEFRHMSVTVPAAYISHYNTAHPVPIIVRGGHSTATALLSGVTSCLRGHYPELCHTGIRQAILQGADKNFPGYDEKLHGQGMLSLTGALTIAQKIMMSSNN
jgi:hypothetical protein